MTAAKPRLVPFEKKASDTKAKARSGAAQMRVAADLVMERDCMEIAEALSKNSKNGQNQSARFLYQLSEQNEQSSEGEGAHKSRSMAMELANSPQWTGDWPKEKCNEDDENVDNS